MEYLHLLTLSILVILVFQFVQPFEIHLNYFFQDLWFILFIGFKKYHSKFIFGSFGVLLLLVICR